MACAGAVGWSGAAIEAMNLRPVFNRDILHFEQCDGEHQARVVLDVDGPGFSDTWLAAMDRLPGST